MEAVTIDPARLALCACGCGRPAPLARRNNARLGHVKGSPLRYISGHNSRGSANLRRYIVDAESGCWTWQGPTNRKGYGRAHVGGVHKNAHRAVYEAQCGELAAGLHLDHLCRNKRCVNPDHLEPVTPAENNRRKYAAPHEFASATLQASAPESAEAA